MKITVEVDEYQATRVKAELDDRLSLDEAATLFVQDIIDRYFSVEYLDVEKLTEEE